MNYKKNSGIIASTIIIVFLMFSYFSFNFRNEDEINKEIFLNDTNNSIANMNITEYNNVSNSGFDFRSLNITYKKICYVGERVDFKILYQEKPINEITIKINDKYYKTDENGIYSHRFWDAGIHEIRLLKENDVYHIDNIRVNKPKILHDSTLTDLNDNKWIPIGPYGGCIRGITIGNNSKTIYVATFGAGVFKSNDHGDTWVSINDGIENPYINVIINYNNSNILFVGTGHDQCDIFYSDNGGNSWEKIEQNNKYFFNEITTMQYINETLYVGSAASYKYSNGKWFQISPDFHGGGFNYLTVDPNNISKLFVNTYHKGLSWSDNSGKTWTRSDLKTSAGREIKINHENSDQIFVGFQEGLFYSRDGGVNWQTLFEEELRTFTINKEFNQIWLAGKEGLYLSKNGGLSWSQLEFFHEYNINSICLNESSNFIYVGTERNGLFRSSDGGLTWKSINNKLPVSLISTALIHPNDSQTIFAGTYGDGLHITRDSGITWDKVSTEWSNQYVQSLHIDRYDDNRIFCSVWEGLYISQDKGNMWNKVNSVITNKYVSSINTLKNGSVLIGIYGEGLLISNDGCKTWRELNSPNKFITNIEIKIQDGLEVYIGTLCGLFISTDLTTWLELSDDLYENCILDFIIDENCSQFYVSTSEGVYVSNNNGSSWRRISDIFDSKYIRSINYNDGLWIGNWDGIYRTNLDLQNWEICTDGLTNKYVNLLDSNNDVIIAGTYGGGIFLLNKSQNMLYGFVYDVYSSHPLLAKIRAEPGNHVTYSNASGYYEFKYLPIENYTLYFETTDMVYSSDNVEVNDSNKRLDHGIQANLNLNKWQVFPLSSLIRKVGLGEQTSFIVQLNEDIFQYHDSMIEWINKFGQRLSVSKINPKGYSNITLRFYEEGSEKIDAKLLINGKNMGFTSFRINVQNPKIHATGLAYDGENVWAVEEPSNAELGKVFRLEDIGGRVAVVNRYVHPAPCPDAVAWDGQYLWSTGTIGPDPIRSWEGGTRFLFKMTINDNVSVIDVLDPPEGKKFHPSGLTWNGNEFVSCHGNEVFKFMPISGEIIIKIMYDNVSLNDMRTIEFVEGYYWVFDTEEEKLSKLDIGSTVKVLETYDVGTIGSYGLCWNGTGFWIHGTGLEIVYRKRPDL